MANRKDRKIAKDVATKKKYQSYYDMMRKGGKQPMTYYHWKKSGRRPVYFKGTSRTKAEAKLPRKNRKRMGLPD